MGPTTGERWLFAQRKRLKGIERVGRGWLPREIFQRGGYCKMGRRSQGQAGQDRAANGRETFEVVAADAPFSAERLIKGGLYRREAQAGQAGRWVCGYVGMWVCGGMWWYVVVCGGMWYMVDNTIYDNDNLEFGPLRGGGVISNGGWREMQWRVCGPMRRKTRRIRN
ncbi:hypothetical protein BZA05DRAFT_196813 [Tricharina praecox]|uniref:uncharacterized protein n=1 Tax=Tricharina praecox TaxID=43433 RepID=UPI002220D432|nr:uncharacterized protein BZA05DRAFT_196813 [Tricharina praecox]KAI5856256.1 hypothetical protein BZA05DRAFT_196813 [Tricharina praecox]